MRRSPRHSGVPRTAARLLRARRRRAGFTLIEMIVAAILLFVGAVAALEAVAAATKGAGVANEMTVATLLAQQHFAELEVDTSQLTGGANSGDFTDEYAGYHWEQNVEATDFPSLVKVTLMITWSSGATPRGAQFVTYEMLPDTSGTTGATTVPGGL